MRSEGGCPSRSPPPDVGTDRTPGHPDRGEHGSEHRRGRGSIGLSEAAEQGTFNVGTAQRVVARVPDPAAGGEVLKLTYTIPAGTTAGVYAKCFPRRAASGSHRPRASGCQGRAPPEQGRQVTAAIEIKGSAGLQRIPLELQPDWHPVEQTIDWPAIGAVKEVVVLVNGISDREPATGTLLIDARFEQLSPLRRLSMSLAAQIRRHHPGRPGPLVPGGTARGTRAGDRGSVAETEAEERREPFPAPPLSAARVLLADLVQGGGVVLIALLVVETFVLGDRGRSIPAGRPWAWPSRGPRWRSGGISG